MRSYLRFSKLPGCFAEQGLFLGKSEIDHFVPPLIMFELLVHAE
jgi:hypothetical protein